MFKLSSKAKIYQNIVILKKIQYFIVKNYNILLQNKITKINILQN